MRFNQNYLLLWGIFCVAITIGSLLPVENLPKSSNLVNDKIQHAAAYFLIGFLALKAAYGPSRQYGLLFISAALGIAIEYLQPLSGRYFEYEDMIANVSGILLAVLIHQAFSKITLFGRNKL
jgi:VanZ family protein